MIPFSYCKPTRIVFGPGRLDELGKETARIGKTALLVQDGGPLEELGILKRATQSLISEGVRCVALSGVLPNPRLTKIDEGIAICKRMPIDIVIGIGGGSAIDSAKAIALGAMYDGDVWDFYSGKAVPQKALPIGAVSTIAGTGAETDGSSIVSNDRPGGGHTKWNVFSPHAYPAFAIMDPGLHVSVPKSLTAAGMADAIAHACEAYMFDFSVQPFMDEYVELLVRCIIECEPLLQRLDDISLRGQVCWYSSQAIDGLGGVGRQINPMARWPAHAIQAGVGTVTNTRHGDGLAVLLPACFLALNEENSVKTSRFAQKAMKITVETGMTDQQIGLAGILALKKLFQKWGLPTSLRELGVTQAQLGPIADAVMEYPGRGLIRREYVEKILNSCY